MACGGTCGGSAPAEKTGGKQPGDVASSKADASAAHACKCVCVCGTPTGVSAPELSDVTIPQPSLNLAAPGPTAEEIEERDLKSRAFDPDAALPAFDALWTQYDPPGPTIDAAPSGAPGGPGIHAPIPGKPPLNLQELYEDRNRPLSSAFALGSGSADVEAPKPLRVVSATWPVASPPPLPMFRANANILYTPNRPVLDARAAPAMPVEPLVSRSPGGAVQGESSAATAVIEADPKSIGAWAYGGSIAPPDATRFPSPEFVGPTTLAPPHAGSFALGGPDAPPGSGIGARAFPIPGSDGTPRWMPSHDAARRTLDSDLDAHREPLPVRVPFGSIEGDLGPGLEPVPRGVKTPDGLLSFRGALTPPLHPDEGPGLSGAALGTMVPLSASLGPARGEFLRAAPVALPIVESRFLMALPGSYAPPAAVGPARTKGLFPSMFLQPSSGPWDLRTATKDAPQVQGYEAEEIRQPPAFPGAEMETAAPEAAADPYAATGRPVQAGLDALKAAMKGVVPVDQWRTPKPEMPGAPTGQKGRGPGLGSLPEISAEFDRAAARRDTAQAAYDKAEAAFKASGGDDPDAAREAAYARYLLDVAKEEVAGLAGQMWTEAEGKGSQWADRAAEQKARDDAAQVAENRRRLEKHDTRPNYFAWEQGDIAEKEARGVRAETKAIEDAVVELGDKLDPATAELIGELTDKLKDLGKELKKKGSDAKDHSKGSEEDASAAAEDLQDTREDLDATRRAIQDALDYASGKTSPAGPTCDGGGTCGGGGGGDGGPAGDGAKAPAKGPKKVEFTIEGTVWPDCGKESEVCKPPTTACPVPGDKWDCGVVKGDPLPGGGGGAGPKGVKGQGMHEARPPDSAAASVDTNQRRAGGSRAVATPEGRGTQEQADRDAEEHARRLAEERGSAHDEDESVLEALELLDEDIADCEARIVTLTAEFDQATAPIGAEGHYRVVNLERIERIQTAMLETTVEYSLLLSTRAHVADPKRNPPLTLSASGVAGLDLPDLERVSVLGRGLPIALRGAQIRSAYKAKIAQVSRVMVAVLTDAARPGAGAKVEQAARLASALRNSIRTTFQEASDPLNRSLAEILEGPRSYEQIRERAVRDVLRSGAPDVQVDAQELAALRERLTRQGLSATEVEQAVFAREIARKSGHTRPAMDRAATLMRRAAIVGMALDVALGAKAVMDAPPGEKSLEAARQSGRVVGGVAFATLGAEAGAWAGLKLGAAMGSAGGPLGAALGGLLGLCLGAYLGMKGAELGSEVAEKSYWLSQ